MNDDELTQARDNFIGGMSRISHFWGFPRAMGAVYGAIYLSPEPLSLDEIVEQVGVTKGAVSTHVRALERLGMVHKRIQIGDRRDYYEAETDFWHVVKTVLREREQQEFDLALASVDESLSLVEQAREGGDQEDLARFYAERMENMRRFFGRLDSFVGMLLALDELSASSIRRRFGEARKGNDKGRGEQ